MATRFDKTIVFDEASIGMGFMDPSAEPAPAPNKVSTQFINSNKKRIQEAKITPKSIYDKIYDIRGQMYYDLDNSNFTTEEGTKKFQETIASRLEQIEKIKKSDGIDVLKDKILEELKKVHKIYPLSYVKVANQDNWRLKVPPIKLKNENVEVEYNSIFLYILIRSNGEARIQVKSNGHHPHVLNPTKITDICYGDQQKTYLKACQELNLLKAVELSHVVLSSYNPHSAYHTLERVANWKNCYYCGDYFDPQKLSGRTCGMCVDRK